MNERFLVHESQAILRVSTKLPLFSGNRNWEWSDRLILIEDEHDEAFWNFTAFDLLMDESRSICLLKSSGEKNLRLLNIFPVNDEFGIIVECFDQSDRFNFVKLDWEFGTFQQIDCFERRSDIFRVFIDKLRPLKFVLKWKNDQTRNYHLIKLTNKKIDFDEIYQTDADFDYYSKDKLINVKTTGHTKEIKTYSWITKKEEKTEVNWSLPENSSLYAYSLKWANDRVYAIIYLWNTKRNGIAWADLNSKRWILLDFEPNSNIQKLQFFNGNLVVTTKKFAEINGKDCEFFRKLYSVPTRSPHLLRYSAWLRVVQIMKDKNEPDPYKAAKEFLPFNSDLREPWFKDEEKK